MRESGAGVAFGQQGQVTVDDVFLSGAASQEHTRTHLAVLKVLWVGVRCDPAIAAGRAIARAGRVTDLAACQAEIVHQGVVYDLQVDTSHTESLDCARTIAARVVG